MSFPWESHLLPDERPFARQALGWMEAAGERWSPVLTDFYDLRRQQIIRMGQVNWAVCEEVSRDLAVGDVLSVRGVGRSKIDAVEGRSRRGRRLLRVAFLR